MNVGTRTMSQYTLEVACDQALLLWGARKPENGRAVEERAQDRQTDCKFIG